MINKLSRTDRVISLPDDQVTEPAIELDSLRNLRELHQLRKVLDLRSDREVIVRQCVGARLQFLAPGANEACDLEVLL